MSSGQAPHGLLFYVPRGPGEGTWEEGLGMKATFTLNARAIA